MRVAESQYNNVRSIACCLSIVVAGCASPAVGDPCLPEQVPERGFDHSESYVESGSVQCETRVCLVYKLGGDPRQGCVPSGDRNCVATADKPCAPVVECPSQQQVDEHVYCSCRCDSGNTGHAECECPAGFACTEVLEQGDEGVRGRYCVRKSTVSQ